MQKMPQPGQQQINIELGESESEGIYSNLALITHSPAEFVIDFTRVLPGKPKAKVYARIIKTPQHAKSLLLALDHIPYALTSLLLLRLKAEDRRQHDLVYFLILPLV